MAKHLNQKVLTEQDTKVQRLFPGSLKCNIQLPGRQWGKGADTQKCFQVFKFWIILLQQNDKNENAT